MIEALVLGAAVLVAGQSVWRARARDRRPAAAAELYVCPVCVATLRGQASARLHLAREHQTSGTFA